MRHVHTAFKPERHSKRNMRSMRRMTFHLLPVRLRRPRSTFENRAVPLNAGCASFRVKNHLPASHCIAWSACCPETRQWVAHHVLVLPDGTSPTYYPTVFEFRMRSQWNFHGYAPQPLDRIVQLTGSLVPIRQHEYEPRTVRERPLSSGPLHYPRKAPPSFWLHICSMTARSEHTAITSTH